MTSDEQDELYMTDNRAKSIEGFCAGLAILAGYMPKGSATKYALGAEHDEIHVWGDVDLTKLPADSDDGRALLALGFHVNDELDQWGYYT